MDSQVLQVIGVAVGGVLLFGGIAFLQFRGTANQLAALEDFASPKGWTVEGDVDGQQWRMKGSFGDLAFVCEAQRPRHDTPPPHARPQRTRVVTQLGAPSGVIVGPKVPAGMATTLLRNLFATTLGPGSDALLSAPIVAIDAPFDAVFEVRTGDEAVARKLLTEPVRTALLGQAKRTQSTPPMVAWSATQLIVQVGKDRYTVAEVEPLIEVARVVNKAARAVAD